ncbi:ATP-binding protein [Streptomyces sp. enrichment culture]|uniref:ATP-binding protein n=1 Tax=Streptomyces sp. enrichment culture TaxID=1795815 RepID=UPI003F559ED6
MACRRSGENEVTFQLPRSRRSVPRARALLHAVLGDWGVGQETLDGAELVLSELVTNAVRVPVPSGRRIGVRITRSAADGLLRLEVSDAGGGVPEVRQPERDETGGRGLLLVAAVAHRWGYEARPGGVGKMVFAELKAPDLVAEPTECEVAAVMVRAGHQVRTGGAWRTVLEVRSDQHAAVGSAVLLLFDDGPALRARATEPLTVRTGPDCG